MDAGTVRAVSTVAVLAVVLAGVWWWTGRSSAVQTIPADPRALSAAGASTGGQAGIDPSAAAVGSPATGGAVSGTAKTAPRLVVDVRGAVRRPGVRWLPQGSRVLDAVAAAGGLRPGSSYGPVNLARPVSDGEQIVVGRRAAAAAPPPAAGAGSEATLVDLNTATPEQLETLDGVGEVIAGRILAWRESNGPFTDIEQLLDVDGIGEQTLAGIRESVRLG